MKVLLVTPPLTQPNTPYPATSYLTGFLRTQGIDVVQADASILFLLELLSSAGLARILEAVDGAPRAVKRRPSVANLIAHRDAIVRVVGPALAFLQRKDASLATRIAGRRYLPEGPRFAAIAPVDDAEAYLEWAFGSNGVTDFARYVASLFLEDLADAIRDGVDPHFGFARYGESLAESAPTLDPLLAELGESRVTALVLDDITDRLLAAHAPDVVGMTIPFPGNVLGALRMAKRIKARSPATRVVWGGGYVNTELRDLSDPRLFALVDAVTYDDGERPLLNLLEHWSGKRPGDGLLRTRLLRDGALTYVSSPREFDPQAMFLGTPTYDGLPLGDYPGMLDMLNPMHRLWSELRWNKLTVARGCYWKKCSFCDVTLDYIRNYDPVGPAFQIQRIEALIRETGTRGFHFVDEAAPPLSLRRLAEALIAKNLDIAWWGNIRFEKTFTPALCKLLAKSGCIAVTGGLEVASNRLLSLMKKGVTVEQVALVTRAFVDAGIKVHAYLMYGFPTQTEQETVDSLEIVRQLFAAGCLDSAFWHRFAATVHAPVGLNPDAYGIRLLDMPQATFARNEVAFADPTGCDHAALGVGLNKALYNYMLGMGFDEDVRLWFEPRVVPKTTVSKRFIAQVLGARYGSRSIP